MQGGGRKVLHLADVHLDRPFIGLSVPDARERRNELRDALDRALVLAAERGVSAITVGGDLWEDEHVTPDTCKWVADRFARAGIPVVVIAGNHDPLRAGGPYSRVEWPENVHLFPADADVHEFRLGSLSLWGVSWGTVPLHARWLESFRVPEDGRSHVLMLHGTTGGAAFQDRAHCPFTGDAVRAAGFELCLAGHLHSAGMRDGIVLYPGSPEPLAWDETGRHSVAVVELVPGGQPSVGLVDFNHRRYVVRNVDCEGARSSADVERALDDAVADATMEFGEGLCLRALLQGRVEVGCEIDLDALRTRSGGLSMLELRDDTRPAFDLDALAEGHTALATFVQDMNARIDASEPQEREPLELALELGLRAMHGDPLDHAS
jgi:DNA repair exonuclease SbcCD nuclease subunit